MPAPLCAADRRRLVPSAGRSTPLFSRCFDTVRDRDRTEGPLFDIEQLSSRQIEILKRLLGGERVPAIARELFVSQSTVRNHLSHIYQRVGVHSQEELLSTLRKG